MYKIRNLQFGLDEFLMLIKFDHFKVNAIISIQRYDFVIGN